MKVMEKDGSIINVFGIYWHNHNNETYLVVSIKTMKR